MGEGKKREAIIIFGDTFTFPNGNAATNRVHTYAKGFSENGFKAYVVCSRSDYTENPDGTFEGIDYSYPFGQKERSKYFLIRRWVKLLKYINTHRHFRKLRISYDILALILYTDNLTIQLYGFLLGKLFNIKIIHERSEHPLRAYQNSKINKARGEIKSIIGTRLCDGIFSISQYLSDFYKWRHVSEEKLLLVPSTVDVTRFNLSDVSPLPFDYIAYCGSLTIKKDGVDILIESFRQLASEKPDIDLVLIGKGDLAEEEASIRKRILQLDLGSRVHFLGQISRQEVPAYLKGARLLALARPRSIVADAGFPSKLTEYLSTGKPVVVTRVGEIPNYLKDMENAYLSEPGSADDFARQIRYVLDNYESALTVGNRGKKLAETLFNYNFQALRMVEFIRSLNSKNLRVKPGII